MTEPPHGLIATTCVIDQPSMQGFSRQACRGVSRLTARYRQTLIVAAFLLASLVSITFPCYASTIHVEAIKLEAVQVVEDSSVPEPLLVAGKPTVLRMFLASTDAPQAALVGSLALTQDGETTLVSSLPDAASEVQTVRLSGGLDDLRAMQNGSLVFVLKPQQAKVGEAVATLTLSSPDPVICTNCSNWTAPLKFSSDPGFVLRVVNYFYDTAGRDRGLRARLTDIQSIESIVSSVFPVGAVSFLVTDIPLKDSIVQIMKTADRNSTTPCDAVNNDLKALRSNELTDHVVPPNAHYYGVVADWSHGYNTMRGCARFSPGIPISDADAEVASGPAGSPAEADLYNWLVPSLSYAGWAAAHEVAHTLGRQHPGCNQPTVDTKYPYGNLGVIARDSTVVGWDYSDGTLHNMGLKLGIGDKPAHDIMTYCPNLWPSAYTYRGLYLRLSCEGGSFSGALCDSYSSDAQNFALAQPTTSVAVTSSSPNLAGPPVNPPGPPASPSSMREVKVSVSGRGVNVLGLLHSDSVSGEIASGEITHVLPVSDYPTTLPRPDVPAPFIVALGAEGQELERRSLAVRETSDGNGSEAKHFDITVKLRDDISAIELRAADNRLLDRRTFSRPQFADNGKIVLPGPERISQEEQMAGPGGIALCTVRWTPPATNTASLRYALQRLRKSADGNSAWVTLAADLSETSTSVLCSSLEANAGEQVPSLRIIVSDGVNTVYIVTDPSNVPK